MKNPETRCDWAVSDPLLEAYHDNEWGIPSYDDRYLFEMLTLEGAQAGLSWLTILRKREGYRDAFENFQIESIAEFDEQKTQSLYRHPGIIRNKLKIQSVVSNARSTMQIVEEYGSFSDYVWQFTDRRVINNQWKDPGEVPASTPISEKMSTQMKKDGFKFVGPTICYSFMQAAGLVNDHVTSCYRNKKN